MRKVIINSGLDSFKNTEKQIVLPIIAKPSLSSMPIGEIRINKGETELASLDKYVIAPVYYIRKIKGNKITEIEIIEMCLVRDEEFVLFRDKNKNEK